MGGKELEGVWKESNAEESGSEKFVQVSTKITQKNCDDTGGRSFVRRKGKKAKAARITQSKQ